MTNVVASLGPHASRKKTPLGGMFLTTKELVHVARAVFVSYNRTKRCIGAAMRESMIVELPRHPVDCRHPMLGLRFWNQVRYRDGEPQNINPERIRHYGFTVADDSKTPRELVTDVVITHGTHNIFEPEDARGVVDMPEFGHVPQTVKDLVKAGRIQLVDVAANVPEPGRDFGEGRRAIYDPATADDSLSLALLLGQLAKNELRVVDLNHRDSDADACYIGPIGTYEETRTKSGRVLRMPEPTGVLWIPRVPRTWESDDQKVIGYVLDLGACDRLECGYIIHRSSWGFVPRGTRFVQLNKPNDAPDKADEPPAADAGEGPAAEEPADPADDGTSRPGQPASLTHRMAIPAAQPHEDAGK